MIENHGLEPTVYAGWQTYQQHILRALRPLTAEQLKLHAGPQLRTIDVIACHIIGARARWFYGLDEREVFLQFRGWDRPEAPVRTAEELVHGLEQTWQGMQAAIHSWTAAEWAQTWPGEDDSEPEIITRQWVIWHLIEHDLFHGGEISLTLGAHGLEGLGL